MGKAERNRQEHARERIASQQIAARRAEARRRTLIAGGSAVVVIAIVVTVVLLGLGSHKSPTTPSASSGRTTNATVVSQITNVPAAVLNAVGAGKAVNPLTTISAAPLSSNGKPEMLYVGAEYCPYCAAERWAMVVALSRFGTFSGLRFIHSTPNDKYSNTATLTFYQSSYVSKYLTFKPVEWFTVANKSLETPTSAEQALLQKYGQGSFPFVDLANKYIVSGAQFLPGVLGSVAQEDPTHHGLTWSEIATQMQNPNSPVAQAVIGAANHITAAICKVTNGQPGNVCKSAAVTSVGGDI